MGYTVYRFSFSFWNNREERKLLLTCQTSLACYSSFCTILPAVNECLGTKNKLNFKCITQKTSLPCVVFLVAISMFQNILCLGSYQSELQSMFYTAKISRDHFADAYAHKGVCVHSQLYKLIACGISGVYRLRCCLCRRTVNLSHRLSGPC